MVAIRFVLCWAVLAGAVTAAAGDPPDPPQRISSPHGIEMVRIPAGTFVMGSPASEPGRDKDEKQHRVSITKPYYMAITEVTQGQWTAVMEKNPSRFVDCGDSCPVELVKWYETIEFCNGLSAAEGLEPAYTVDRGHVKWDTSANGYRLPTEAEWEYACRAGTATPFWNGRCLSTDEANYNGNHPLEGCPTGEYRNETVPVASFPPNPWGLYDMHGNVWEWCWDRMAPYPKGAVSDPSGPPYGTTRVIRGGGWHFHAFCSRSANRDDGGLKLRYIFVGMRLARNVP
jgi:formylglycine-generating enzyme required for sulfatase activity